MRVAIFGAGSLGTVLGAFITKGGVPIDLVNRNLPHIEALKNHGARVTGTVDFVQEVSALTPDRMSGKYDIIFLMTKRLSNPDTVDFLKDFLPDDGVIVTLQNGIPETEIAPIVGDGRVLGCTVGWGASMKEPGVCVLGSSPDSLTFTLGSLSGKGGNHLEDVKSLLSMVGPVTVGDNFLGARWSKLLINSSFGGMSAVLGGTFGEVASDFESRKVLLALIYECIAVCKAAGIKLEPVQGKDITRLFDSSSPVKKAFALLVIPAVIKKHSHHKASMLQDLEKGKKTEIDSINGAVCAMGHKVGVPTPMNDLVVDTVHQIENGLLRPCRANLPHFFE